MAKVLELLLKEGSGLTVNDSSGNANHGEISNGVWQQLNNAIQRNVVYLEGGYIKVPQSESLNLTTFTASIWFNRTRMVDEILLNSQDHSAYPSPGGILVYLLADGRLCFTPSNGTVHYYIYSTKTLGYGWHRVSVSIGFNVAKIYVDGEVDGSQNVTGQFYPSADLVIGQYGENGGDNFKGQIGTVEVYNTPLNSEEEAAEYLAEMEQFMGLLPPSQVTGLQMVDARYNALSLIWNENILSEGVDGYRLYQDDVLIAELKTTSFIASNLLPQHYYTFKVTAWSEAGEGSPALLTVSTPARGTATSAAIYITPAIQTRKILPDTATPGTPGNKIELRSGKGCLVPASFVVKANAGAISQLQATVSGGNLPTGNVDIKAVGCWMQSPDKYYAMDSVLTPELLLKDEALVRVTYHTGVDGNLWGSNFVKVNGGYVFCGNSDPELAGDPNFPDRPKYMEEVVWPDMMLKPEDFPVSDADTLQPVEIPAGQNRQFWITVKIPADMTAGLYATQISLDSPSGHIATLDLEVEVLSFALPAYPLTDNVYYDGHMQDGWPDGSIGRTYKSDAQLRAEYQDMFDHGVNYPMCSQSWDNLDYFGRVLDIIFETGFPTDRLYLMGKESNLGYGTPTDQATLDAIRSEVSAVVQFCHNKGFSDIYFYGIDEHHSISPQLPAWEAIHAGGGKVFVADRDGFFNAEGRAVLDHLNDSTETNWSAIAEKWHQAGNQICQYSNPQCGLEDPVAYRRYLGLQIWQADLDGVMDWSYQGHYGYAWNEYSYGFRHDLYNIHGYMMTYPTINGVVDTLQWEGWREGVTDLRYVKMLEDTIAEKKAEGQDTTEAEAFMTSLLSLNTTDANLDFNLVRENIIDQILILLGEIVPPPAPTSNSLGIIFAAAAPFLLALASEKK